MPFSAPTVIPPAPGPTTGGRTKESEITVIPEKFYGAALKMKPPFAMDMTVQPAARPVPAPLPKPQAIKAAAPAKKIPWAFIAIGVLFLLAIAGGFLYFERDVLFKKPAPAVVAVQPPQLPPAPSGLSAALSGTNVSLQWGDVSTLETGYRIERKEGDTTYLPLTTLPANSTVFLDTSTRDGNAYLYRIIALGASGESPASNESGVNIPAAAPVVAPVVTPPAPTLPAGGLDSDSDGLSDLEETLYGTDARSPDSDGDSYLDGNEVFHLYSPTVKAPSSLLSSGMVTTWRAPAGWTLYVPTAWTKVLDATDGSRATIDTKHGETFVITIEDNATHLSLDAWYTAAHPEALSTSVRSFVSKGGLQGIMAGDQLDAYFLWDGKVFHLHYNIDGQTFINYRTTFEMMLNSLKLVGAPQVTPPPEATQAPGSIMETATSTTGPAVAPVLPPMTVTATTTETVTATTTETVTATTTETVTATTTRP